jgi:hypothetical protein
MGNQNRNYIAAIDATTGKALPWNPSADYIVNSIVANGKTIYAAGGFSTIGGQKRGFIAALDSATGNATSWAPVASGNVYSMALSGNTMYAAGDFGYTGGAYRNYMAALDILSGKTLSWNPNADYDVYSVTVNGPIVYVGGQFHTIGGQYRSNVAALDATTGNALEWNPKGTGGPVALIVVSGSTAYVGGYGNYGQPADHLFFSQYGDFYPAPAVQSISPASAINTVGPLQLLITGSNFHSDATVKLSKAGCPDIIAADVSVASSSHITCIAQIVNVASGSWDVVVANGDTKSSALVNGFMVTSSLAIPSAVVLKTPAMGDPVKVDSVLLAWLKGSPQVDRYSVEYGIDSSFAVKTTDSAVIDTVKRIRN